MPRGVYFPNVPTPIYAEITVSRGILPSCAVLTMVPSDRLNLGPGTLTFQDSNGNTVEFPDCLPLTPYAREAFVSTDRSILRPRWSLTILDHRWHWAYGSISGEWNRRVPDGTLDTTYKKEPAELANILLTAMGESGYDTSRMPTGVYPYVNWKNLNPAIALWDLCERVACEITGGEKAEVTIWPRGQGQTLPTTNAIRQPARFPLASKPSRIVVRGGPTTFQNKLQLKAIGRETDGTQKLVDDLTYKPSGGWSVESPIAFPSLTGDNLAAALETVWRWYRVKGQQDGSLPVPGCDETIANVTQYFPLRSVLLDAGNDLDSVKQPLPAYVEGQYWAYTEDTTDTAASTRYQGPWTLLADKGIVAFKNPVFSMSSSGAIQAPTSLYLNTTYQVRKQDGSGYVSLERSRNIGGNAGELTLQRPELYGSLKNGASSTLPQAEAEADKYLDIFSDAYASAEMDDEEYPFILSGSLDGKIAQVRYCGGVNRDFRTRASTYHEFDIYSVGAKESRRRNLVEMEASA